MLELDLLGSMCSADRPFSTLHLEIGGQIRLEIIRLSQSVREPKYQAGSRASRDLVVEYMCIRLMEEGESEQRSHPISEEHSWVVERGRRRAE